MGIVVFSKPGCMQCDVLKDALTKAGISYTEKTKQSLREVANELEDTAFEDGVYSCTSFPVVTSLDDNGAWIGGFEDAMKMFSEPLLAPNSKRHSMYPITYPDIYEMYKKARASYWQPEEISLAKDMADWESMTDDERHFVSYILAFFSASDGIVNENIDINFSKEVQIPEARAFYAFQEAIEAVHSETYSILLDTYVTDPKKKLFLQEGVATIPSVAKKADWANRYMASSVPFAHRLVAFACVEGIYFSGSFCAIYWLKKRGLLPGLSFSNELIARDEALHTEFAVLLYSYVKNRLSETAVREIVADAVENEKGFINESLPCRLIGMNSDMMSTYIEFVADRLLSQLGYNKMYHSENPFDFMENISLSGKTNFFEKRVGEYAKAGVMASSDENAFDLDADF